MGGKIMKHILKMQYPASWWHDMWREGLPVGNGFTGASLYGGSKREILQLSRHDFWYNGKAGELPDVHEALESQREKMDAGSFQEASWEIVNRLRESGYESSLEAHIPLARMIVTQKTEKGFRRFERGIDMERALAFQQWTDNGVPMRREVFVSRCGDMVIYRLTAGETAASAQTPSDGTSSAQAPAGSSYRICLETYRNDGEPEKEGMKEIWDSEQKELSVEETGEGWIYLHAVRRRKNEEFAGFGAVASVCLPAGGRLTVSDHELQVEGAAEVLIKVCLYSEGDRDSNRTLCRERLENCADRSFDELLEESAALHGKLYHSAELSLGAEWKTSNEELLLRSYRDDRQPTELIEKLWHYGRYLFICGSNPQANPFPLYGLWGGRYRPMWCHNMANENIQMIYWHSFVGNLGEYHQAMFRYLNERIPAFRENGRKLFGIDGVYLTAGTTPGVSEPTQVVPVIINWVGAAGWMAQHYYQYYLFTGDEKYGREVMLPYLDGVASFYEKFVRFQEKDGKECIKLYPSVSPENTPQNFMPPEGEQMAHPMPTTINSTIDLAILKEFFTNMLLLEEKYAGKVFDWERTALWRRILKAIPSYACNGEGAIKEWQDERFEDRYDHRHLSHIYPVFPGHECYTLRNPDLEEGFEKAVKLRKVDAQTGWSMAHMAAIYARFRDGAAAMGCLDNMAKSSLLANFFTLHNDWRGMNVSVVLDQAPVQLDALMGYVNALQEMLVYTAPGYMALLPAPEERIVKGKLKNFRYYDGFLSMEWNLERKVLKGELRAVRSHRLELVLPDGMEKLQFEKNGDVPSEKKDGVWVLDFTNEETFQFEVRQ